MLAIFENLTCVTQSATCENIQDSNTFGNIVHASGIRAHYLSDLSAVVINGNAVLFPDHIHV